jgi:hypothetical protein
MPTIVKSIGNINNGAITWNNTAGSAVIGSVTNLGSWTLGSITTAATHTIQSSGDPLNLVTSNPNNHLGFLYNTSTVGGYIRSNATAPFFFLNGSASELGRVTSSGAWTLGGSGFTGSHNLFGYSYFGNNGAIGVGRMQVRTTAEPGMALLRRDFGL